MGENTVENGSSIHFTVVSWVNTEALFIKAQSDNDQNMVLQICFLKYF